MIDPLAACDMVDPCNPDLIDPVASCHDITVQLDNAGNASITTSQKIMAVLMYVEG